MRPIVTLTTDFGIQDNYVGVMKGVILGICPDAHLIDITHAIPRHNIGAVSFVLQNTIPYFPQGTVHLVVVDPGVGSKRRALALATPDAYYVGPDNGVFGPLWQAACNRWSRANIHAVELTDSRFWRPDISSTFHGRDIFAPVAAHLATGVALEQFGPALDTIVTSPQQEPVHEHSTCLLGWIISVDHFGNCVTNISEMHLTHLGPHNNLEVLLDEIGHPLSIQHTYADAEPERVLALIGSHGNLEVAIRNGNASRFFTIDIGTRVRVRIQSETQ